MLAEIEKNPGGGLVHFHYETSLLPKLGEMVNRLKSKIPGLLLAVVLLALLVVPVMAANEFEIKGANVYSGYIEEGDWLVVIEYHNVLEPYYSNDTSIDSFQLQLVKVDNTTLIAQTPLAAWGWKPGSIYLSAATVASLEWGEAYVVKMVGAANTTIYTLTTADWRGSDLVILDDWCRAVATRMETYYNTTFLVPSPDVTTEALNEEGAVMFVVGIPYLHEVRPNLFILASYSPDWQTTNWTGAYETSLPPWNEAVGDNIATAFNATGAAMGLEGIHVAGIILAVVYFGFAFIMGRGHALQGLVMASPVLIVGFYFRIIPWAVLFVAVAIVAVFLVRQFWAWRTG